MAGRSRSPGTRLGVMDHRPPFAIGARTAAGGLTLAVHGLLLTVLLLEDRELRRPLPSSRTLAQTWIHLAPVQAPPREAPEARIPAAPATAPEDVQAVLPASLEAVATMEAEPASPAGPAPVPAPIDWATAAADRASHYGEEEKPPAFDGPVATLREPCKPRDSSFEWSPAEKKAGLFPLPYVMIGERCVVGLGFFACALGALPPPNKHLFDDMQQGLTPGSSVPDPHFCD